MLEDDVGQLGGRGGVVAWRHFVVRDLEIERVARRDGRAFDVGEVGDGVVVVDVFLGFGRNLRAT